LAQNSSFLKRQKELARLDKQREKAEKRKQRKVEKERRAQLGQSEEYVTRDSLE